LLKTGVQSAKMAKLADFGQKTSVLCKLVHFTEKRKKWCAQCEIDRKCQYRLNRLFCTNSCTLLKIAKKWCAQCENDKTCSSWAEKAVLYKLVDFGKNRLKVVRPVRKTTKRAYLGLKT